jgi:hypothetical protein
MRIPRAAACLVLAAMAAGCAASGPRPEKTFRDGDYAAALILFKERVAASPDDAKAHRGVAACLYEMGRTEQAVEPLSRSLDLNPNDPASLYMMGRVHERLGDLRSASGDDATAQDAYQVALRAYAAYLHRETGDRQVQAQVQKLRRTLLALEARRAIDLEMKVTQEGATTPNPPSTTLAVHDFHNLGSDSTLTPLGKGIASMLITDLSSVEEFRVVERQRIRVLLDELERTHAPAAVRVSKPAAPDLASVAGMKTALGLLRDGSGTQYYRGPVDDARDEGFTEAVRRFQSDAGLGADGIPGPKTRAAMEGALEQSPPAAESAPAFDPKTVPVHGRLLSAGTVVQGSFVDLGDGRQIRLDADLIAVESGGIRSDVDPVSGDLPRILHLEKDLLAGILDGFGIQLSKERMDRLMELPTESFEAFLAYSRGVDLEDRGFPGRAAELYEEAYRIDPRFDAARAAAETASLPEPDGGDGDRLADVGAGGESSTGDRLERQGSLIGLVPPPDIESEPDAQQTPPTVVNPEGTIVVTGDVPGEGR